MKRRDEESRRDERRGATDVIEKTDDSHGEKERSPWQNEQRGD